MNKTWNKIYYYLFPGSVDEQEKRYIEENGYPEESVTFVDSRGRVSQIIGRKTLINNIELFNKSSLNKKSNKIW